MPSPISKPTNRDGREARKALCWNDFDAESSEYFLRLKDALRYDDPQAAVRRFCSSTFARIMERQNWERRDWFTEPLLNG